MRRLDPRPDPVSLGGYYAATQVAGYNAYAGRVRTAGKQVPTTAIAPWTMELAWRVERMRTLFGGRPLVTKASARTASRQRLYDGSKARKVLGMEFRKAEEAVANTERFLRGQ